MINETCAKNEALERELGTQKEILRQFDQSKRELVGKLMADLWSVESRWLQVLDRNNMVGEDYRMRAVLNHENLCKEQELTAELEATLAETKQALKQAQATIEALKLAHERTQMEHEDYLRHYSRENGKHRQLKREHTKQTSELEQAREENAYHL